MIKNILLHILLIIILASCSKASKQDETVSVTILPQKYIIDCLTDSTIKVNVLVPQGMNPESCDFTIETLKALNDSKACFYFGTLPFEEEQLIPMLTEKSSIQNIPLISSCPSNSLNDPHLWLLPSNAKGIATEMSKKLKELFPHKAESITENCKTLCARIDSLDLKIRTTLSGKTSRAFLIYHPALTYFAHEYNLEQIAIENDGKEPSPDELKNIIQLARNKGVKILFMQRDSQESSAEIIVKEVGCKIVTFDPLAPNYMAEMNRLSESIEQNLD